MYQIRTEVSDRGNVDPEVGKADLEVETNQAVLQKAQTDILHRAVVEGHPGDPFSVQETADRSMASALAEDPADVAD